MEPVATFLAAFGVPDHHDVRVVGEGTLPSVYAVTELAVASIAAAALAARDLGTSREPVVVDRGLASHWFAGSIRPHGWTVPSPWDPIAGDYRGADGWIRLHTNAPHHRAAALGVLGRPDGREAVAAAVAGRPVGELEDAVVAAGGCAAAMRTTTDWSAHPQGRAVAAEPLVDTAEGDEGPATAPVPRDPARPLAGVRVLDLTRVLAGPVATRFLAGLGAEVIRVDPPEWDEPGVVPEVTLGKRCIRLDLRTADGLAHLRSLLAGADVLVHGLRGDALERLGLGPGERRRCRPGLVDVALDAYGWTGPWATRRGFDSLVQMSSGIAAAGARAAGADRPVPLPVQALDHATGYLVAAAALRGWRHRLETGTGVVARTSLAAMARVLVDGPAGGDAAPVPDHELEGSPESTPWGPAARLRPPVVAGPVALRWDRPATALGSSPAGTRWTVDAGSTRRAGDQSTH